MCVCSFYTLIGIKLQSCKSCFANPGNRGCHTYLTTTVICLYTTWYRRLYPWDMRSKCDFILMAAEGTSYCYIENDRLFVVFLYQVVIYLFVVEEIQERIYTLRLG